MSKLSLLLISCVLLLKIFAIGHQFRLLEDELGAKLFVYDNFPHGGYAVLRTPTPKRFTVFTYIDMPEASYEHLRRSVSKGTGTLKVEYRDADNKILFSGETPNHENP